MVSVIAFVILIAGIRTSLLIQALHLDDDAVIITTDATLLWNYRDDKGLNGTVPAEVFICVNPKKGYFLKGYSPERRPAGCSVYLEADGEFRARDYNSPYEQLYRKYRIPAKPELVALLSNGEGYVMTYNVVARRTIRPNGRCYSDSKKAVDVKQVTMPSPPSSSWNLMSRLSGIGQKLIPSRIRYQRF